jgi:transposase InsO family protein
VQTSLRVLKLGKQSYYEWRRAPLSKRERENEQLLPLIKQIHANDPEYGYRFITDELKELGWAVNEKRVLRLCREHRIYATIHKKGRLHSSTALPTHDDLVRRNFSATGPNQLWLTDITEHQTQEGKIYLCALKDVYSNRIVGYSLGDRMTARLAVEALDNAMQSRGCPKRVVVHSDRGSQFRSHAVKQRLRHYSARGSMGRTGSFADNAAMESFYSLVQKNVLNRQKYWRSKHELRIALMRWINVTYNSARKQRALGRMTPIEYEAHYARLCAVDTQSTAESRVR